MMQRQCIATPVEIGEISKINLFSESVLGGISSYYMHLYFVAQFKVPHPKKSLLELS